MMPKENSQHESASQVPEVGPTPLEAFQPDQGEEKEKNKRY